MQIKIKFEEKYRFKDMLQVLREKKIYINAPCNGKGKCGKCKIKILNGNVKLGEENYKLLSKNELQEGNCLACSSFFAEDCIIETGISNEEGFDVVSAFEENNQILDKPRIKIHQFSLKEESLEKTISITKVINKSLRCKFKYSFKAIKKLASLINNTKGEDIYEEFIDEKEINIIEEDGVIIDILKKDQKDVFGVAIDIGTTTVVLSLIDMTTGEIKKTNSFLNSQRKFGADVISRIEYSMQDNVDILRKCICDDILKGIEELTSEFYKKESIYHIVVSGNTTMINLFLGLPCDSIAQYPFNTVMLDLCKFKFKEVFKNELLDCNVTVLPGISAYVGADITSGILKCNMHGNDKISIFVDIGTNGEMAIGNKDNMLCLATAAGPAFEGANITCGTGSIKGAISQVSIINKKIDYKTIGNYPPVGICGSAVIDIVASLKKEEVIDETGRIDKELYKEDKIIIAKDVYGQDIIFNQKDIRELQLGKSAIRSGIEILIKEYNTSYENIDVFYIAGGFGNKINIENSAFIGLIPEELKNKVKTVGNSSLGGASLYLCDKKYNEDIEYVLNNIKYIDISKHKDFNNLFIDNMLI